MYFRNKSPAYSVGNCCLRMVSLLLSCANCHRLLTSDPASLWSMSAYSFFNIEIFKENTQPLCRKYTASLREIDGISINRIMHFYDSPKRLHKFIFSLKSNPCGCGNTSGDIVESFWGEFDFGGYSRTRVMMLSVLCLGPQFPNIQCLDVCECLGKYIMLFGSISPVRPY